MDEEEVATEHKEIDSTANVFSSQAGVQTFIYY